DSFDHLVLRGNAADSWTTGQEEGSVDADNYQRFTRAGGTYLRDQWMRDSQREMGGLPVRGTFVHVFLNGLYWGVYNLMEQYDENFMRQRYWDGGWDILEGN